MTADLVIAGAGGFARETVAAIAATNAASPGDPPWRLLGLLDDDPALLGRDRGGARVLGPIGAAPAMPETSVVLCVGNPTDPGARARVGRRLGLAPDRYATITHPAASVGAGCVIGPGSVLLAGAVLTAGVTIGAHVSVMPHAALTHDDVVEEYVTVASGVRLGGGVRLGAGCYLGAGAMVREGQTIGPGALVGMGAVVLTDVPAGQVWVGNPARYLRDVRERDQRSESCQ